jgi:hypothetical protein
MKKTSLEVIQARRIIIDIGSMIFDCLAILVTFVTVDPLALRPRLSPGLPFSDVFFNGYSILFSSDYLLQFHYLWKLKLQGRYLF